MCDQIARAAADPTIPAANRREFLKVLGTTAAAAGLVAATAGPAWAGNGSSGGRHRGRTRLVLLGTAGGPTVQDGRQAGISTAIVYGDRVYLVDLGIGSLLQLRRWQTSAAGATAPSALSGVRGIFFTHMHSDHLADWPATWVTGPSNALGRSGPPIEVFGPGERGTLPRVNPPGRAEPAVVAPERPVPGIRGTTESLTRTWANDLNDRIRDSAFAHPDLLFHVQDIDLTGIWTPDPAGVPPRLSASIPVWQDGDVRVTATLVDHHPTAPAFAYRFDTPDGSITVSGDTTVSANLIDLARGTDHLVHEVIDPAFADRLAATLPPQQGAALKAHLLEAHTTIEQVGRDVAQPAGAKNLVLTHLVPSNTPKSRWQAARKGYSGKLIVGEDLTEISLG